MSWASEGVKRPGDKLVLNFEKTGTFSDQIALQSVQLPLFISADGYSEDHIKFKWEKDLTDGMSFVPTNLEMLPQYTLTRLSLTKIHNVYVVGTY